MLLSYSLAALSLATSFVSARPLPLYRRQAPITDFGSCNATPDIIFALGLDGRKDPSFQAKNNDVYNHGSALGIGVITSFICQQLNDKCKAPAATLDACAAGQAAAAKETAGAAADAFNDAFGIQTKFGSSGPNGGAGATTTGVAATSSPTGASSGPATETATAPEAATTTTSAATDTATTCPATTTVTVTVDPTATATDAPCPTDPVTVTVTGATPTATETATETGTGTATETAATTTDTAAATTATETSAATETPSPSAAPPASTGAASSLDFGSCTNPTIEFGPAFEGRKAAEFSNKPVDKTEFPQASALNINIITRAICDILANKCKAPQATLDACTKGQAAAAAAPAGGAGADAFNGALGIQSDFTNVPAAPGGGPGSVALATTPNFGTCSNPTIVFGVGFDGRTEASFQPANKASFNHDSALNPKIITQSICDTLVGPCNANKPAIDSCKAAQAASTDLTGQEAADAFNAAVTKGAP
ncbi:hypothetical protein FRC12_009928 [Ceratobasidium sp. 428]|nr:hypothetical protein FRC12_009928 [Ceratobasidium sp. 428]